MIMGTMSGVLIYFLLSFWNLRMIGDMSFPGMLGFSTGEHSGRQMLLAGVLQLIWTVLSLYWLLPNVFDFGGLGLRSQVIALGAAGCSVAYGVLKIVQI
ncbi:hypothetical protein [Paenibacillus xylanivorans]|uniref:Uncharacterized protein n=1 Tax=Paenibacillus xylanivorans TaxID=1705561 RepID=A0A0M9BMA8_9BACL|nr:hypothetical protein [Paenibacillus xylanivorans]KOY14366.1 hypothetical protein AMS66_20430 [Paenibacillus xylanivorans]